MKLTMALILLPMVSASWQIAIWNWKEKAENFLSNPFSPSRIPQFLLDAKHPWVIENRNKLERLPNVEAYLCYPSEQSEPDSGRAELGGVGNGLSVPPDLFDSLEINNRWGGVSRPGWPNALMRLQEINRCPAALSQVRTFKTSIYPHNGEYSDWSKKIFEPSRPPKEVLDLFTDVLGSMTSLGNLTWDIARSDAHYFEEHFSDRRLVLPTVTRLDTGPDSHFLVRMCPNLTSLEIGDSTYLSTEADFLPAAMSAPNLTRFAMNSRWTISMIEDLVAYMPGLQSLGLWGGLSAEYKYDAHSYVERDTLKDALQVLSSLKNLTHLELPYAYELHLGWDGGPWCGNAYDGRGGRQYQRDVALEGAEAVDRAAAIVVGTLPRLDGFSIGSRHANITRYENGTARASFPWTGRRSEWALDVVPHLPCEDESNDEVAC